ncbi:protein of unknown function [Aminobacter niigataensis]|nr:protein of unknown function [Aminobacter niigataensis]
MHRQRVVARFHEDMTASHEGNVEYDPIHENCSTPALSPPLLARRVGLPGKWGRIGGRDARSAHRRH